MTDLGEVTYETATHPADAAPRDQDGIASGLTQLPRRSRPRPRAHAPVDALTGRNQPMPRRTHYAPRDQTTQVSVVVQRRIAAALDAIAKRDQVSRAETIRRAIADALARDQRRELRT